MYKQICKNLRALEKAMTAVQLELRKYISKKEKVNKVNFTKIFSLLITMWSEMRLLKLVYEKSAFTDEQIDAILKNSSLKDKWVEALLISFRKAYKIKRNYKFDKLIGKLDFTPKARLNVLYDLINNDLFKTIQVRNRIAHGQWVIAFNEDLKGISTVLTEALNTENIVTLQMKRKIFVTLSNIIHNLAVSPSTYERDFDSLFRVIEEQRRNLHNRSIGDYERRMREKYIRGLEKRRANQK